MNLVEYQLDHDLASTRLLQHRLLDQTDVGVRTQSCEYRINLDKNAYVRIVHALTYPTVLCHLDTEYRSSDCASRAVLTSAYFLAYPESGGINLSMDPLSH